MKTRSKSVAKSPSVKKRKFSGGKKSSLKKKFKGESGRHIARPSRYEGPGIAGKFKSKYPYDQRHSWFENLFGFKESDGLFIEIEKEQKNSIFEIPKEQNFQNTIFKSLTDEDRKFNAGIFFTPFLGELRELQRHLLGRSKSTLRHYIVNDILEEHGAHRNSTFQVASQFNYLEFARPEFTPERGITEYQNDMTQGPACALACAPATLYRNSFVEFELRGTSYTGQSESAQLNGLRDLGNEIGERETSDPTLMRSGRALGKRYWEVNNGYIESTEAAMTDFNKLLKRSDREYLKSLIRVGIVSQAQIAFLQRWKFADEKSTATQVFCSAIGCDYSRRVSKETWEPLARLVLEAAYEACMYATAWDYKYRRGTGQLFLTKLGGGVFGNREEWIIDAIAHAYNATKDLGIGVHVCHFRQVDELFVRDLERKLI
jgi:hypothetical protein